MNRTPVTTEAVDLYRWYIEHGHLPVTELARRRGISRQTVYRELERLSLEKKPGSIGPASE